MQLDLLGDAPDIKFIPEYPVGEAHEREKKTALLEANPTMPLKMYCLGARPEHRLVVNPGASTSTPTQAIDATDDADIWLETLRHDGEHMRCMGMDISLRASFDKIASEQVLLEQYLDTFVGDGEVAMGDTETISFETGGAPGAAIPNSVFANDTQPCAVSTLQLLFECVYSPSGVYNQLFRRQIQAVARSRAEQLQKAKQIYDILILVSNSSMEMYRDHQDLIEQVLDPFVRLGGLQTRGLCELHHDDLVQWLTMVSASTITMNSDPTISANKPGFTNLLTVYETGEFGVVVGPVNASEVEGGETDRPDYLEESLPACARASSAMLFSSLDHIGRVNPELVFLSKLAEIGVAYEVGAHAGHAHEGQAPMGEDLAAQVAAIKTAEDDISGFAGFFAQLPSFVSFGCTSSPASTSSSLITSSDASSSSIIPTNEYTNPLHPTQHPSQVGLFIGKERESQVIYESYLKVLGYPWFVRQFLVAAMSHMSQVDEPNKGIVCTPVGRFLGFKLRAGSYRELPPIVFRHQVLSCVRSRLSLCPSAHSPRLLPLISTSHKVDANGRSRYQPTLANLLRNSRIDSRTRSKPSLLTTAAWRGKCFTLTRRRCKSMRPCEGCLILMR
jgi:hypothetical protein